MTTKIMKTGVVITILLILLICLSGTSISVAQKDTTDKKKNFLQRMDSIQQWKIKHGRSTLTPYIAPAYTPEMQFSLSVGGLYTFMMQQDNPVL